MIEFRLIREAKKYYGPILGCWNDSLTDEDWRYAIFPYFDGESWVDERGFERKPSHFVKLHIPPGEMG